MNATTVEKTVRVVSSILLPYVNPCFTQFPDNCSHPGYEIRFIHLALTSMGLIPSYHQVENFREMTRVLGVGEYDISGFTVPMNTVRPNISLTQPCVQASVRFLVPAEYSMGAGKDYILSEACSFEVYFIFSALLAAIYGSDLISKILLPERVYKSGMKCGKTVYFLVLGIVLSVFTSFMAIRLSSPPQKKPLFSNIEGLFIHRAIGQPLYQDDDQYKEPVAPTIRRCLGPNKSKLAGILKDHTCKIVGMSHGAVSHSILVPDESYLWIPEETRKSLRESHKSNPPLTAENSFRKMRSLLLDAPEGECRIGFVSDDLDAIFTQMFGEGNIELLSLPEAPKSALGYAVYQHSEVMERLNLFFSAGSPSDVYTRIASEAKQGIVKHDAESANNNYSSRKSPTAIVQAASLGRVSEIFWLLLVASAVSLFAFGIELTVESYKRSWLL